MDTDLDTRASALFVKTDDLLKSSPQLAPWRPPVGITPQLSDAELVSLAMMQVILGFTSEARWLRHDLIGDKNYFGRDFEAQLAGMHIELVRPARKG